MAQIGDKDALVRAVAVLIPGALGFVANRLPFGVDWLVQFGALGGIVAVSCAAISMIVYRHVICRSIQDPVSFFSVVTVAVFVAMVGTGIVYFVSLAQRTFEYDGRRFVAGKEFVASVTGEEGDRIVIQGVHETVEIHISNHLGLVMEAAATPDNDFTDVWTQKSVDRAKWWLAIKYLCFCATLGLLFGCATELVVLDPSSRHGTRW